MKAFIENIKRHARAHLLLSLCLCGAAGGFLNGLLGAGSGIIFIFALSALLSEDGEKEQKDIFTLSLQR